MSANPDMTFDELVEMLERAARDLPDIDWDDVEIVPVGDPATTRPDTDLRHSTHMTTTVRLRTDDPVDDLCHGYCDQTGEFHWYSNSDIVGAVTIPDRVIPNLDPADDQENYWWVQTPAGSRIAFQSIDVEEDT